MFQSLTDRLSGVLDKLTRRGALTEADVSEAMREVRRALLEADVGAGSLSRLGYIVLATSHCDRIVSIISRQVSRQQSSVWQ